MITLSAVLLLLQAPAEKDGLDLLKKVIARARDAKTIRIVATAEMGGERPRNGSIDLQIRGAAEFRAVMVQDNHVSRIKSDGKNMIASGRAHQVDPKALKLDELMKWLRHRAAMAPTLALDFLEPSVLMSGIPEIDKATIEGEERIDRTLAKIVAYEFPYAGGKRIAYRAWIDPEKLVVLKREARLGPMILLENVSVMEYDADIPADEFAAGSTSELKRALDEMAATCAELYGMCIGNLPANPETLSRRTPAGFWPEGGFWIGGKKPAAFGRELSRPSPLPLVPPSDRLAKQFTAHVRIRLLNAAAQAYEAATWKLPQGLGDLCKEGFVSDEAMLKDPWGRPFEFAVRKNAVVIRCAPGNVVLESDLNAPELKALETGNPAWRRFMAAPRAVTYSDGPGRPDTNERGMKQNLGIVEESQVAMFNRDFDKDEKTNFWVKDVAGIFAEGREELRAPWLNLAKADVTPGRGAYPALKGLAEPEPFYAAYLLSVLKRFVDDGGKEEPYDDGTGRNALRYGIVAYPETYGNSGFLTYILTESGMWSKDLEGAEIDALPRDLSGWSKLK